jgi:hypothetical protein
MASRADRRRALLASVTTPGITADAVCSSRHINGSPVFDLVPGDPVRSAEQRVAVFDLQVLRGVAVGDLEHAEQARADADAWRERLRLERMLRNVPPPIGIHDRLPGGSTPEEWPAGWTPT